jgi:hypothetical protein
MFDTMLLINRSLRSMDKPFSVTREQCDFYELRAEVLKII